MRRTLLLLVLLGCADLAPPPDGPPEEMTGAWIPVARSGERSVLARLPDRADGRGTPPDTLPVEVGVYTPGEGLARASLRLHPVQLPGVAREQARPLRLGWAMLGERTVPVALPGEAPQLLHSPADPSIALFEEAGTLWIVSPGMAPRRAVREGIAGFDRGALSARQREGEVILYWAAAPVWSPDGSRIAYATNREAVQRGSPGQSIWLLSREGGDERPLVADPGRSYRPIGWLGDELLFIGELPGIHAVDPASGRRRTLAAGLEVGVAPDGSALAVGHPVEGGVEVRVLSESAEVVVPAPPDGFVDLPQGSFSPTGRRLLLESAADGGASRRFAIYDRAPARRVDVDSVPAGAAERPIWLDDRTLLLHLPGSDGSAPRTRFVPVD